MAEVLGSAILELSTDNTGLEKGLKDGEKAANKAMGALRTVAVGGGLAAAAAIGAIGTSAFNISKDTQKATKRIQSQLRTTEKEAKRLGKAAQGVFKDNFADNVIEAGDAVMLLHQQLGDAARDQERELVGLAFGLRDDFGPEVDDVIAAVSTLTEEFEDLDPGQAFDIIAAGFQKGLDKSGDFLESIGEYSNLFADAGFEADEFFSLMETGQAGGILGTDKMADAFKEFQIRLIEGSDDVADALNTIGLNSEEIFQGLSDGTLDVKDVFEELLPAINSIEDPLERNRALVELMGTQAEDLGTNFTEGIDTGKTSLEEMKGAADSLSTQYNNLGDNLSKLWRTITVEVAPLSDDLVTLVNNVLPKVDEWVGTHLPKLVTAIQNFRAAPLTSLLSPTADDYAAFIGAGGGGDYTAFVAKRRVMALFGVPENSENILLDALKAQWTNVKNLFNSWLTAASGAADAATNQIRDFFYIQPGETFVEGLKAWWPVVKSSFEAWLAAGQRIAGMFDPPTVEDTLVGLKLWWGILRVRFGEWITSAQQRISEMFESPSVEDAFTDLKTWWTTLRTRFGEWIITAQQRITEMFEPPTVEDALTGLKIWWAILRLRFGDWIKTARQRITEMFEAPTVEDAIAGLKLWWGIVRVRFGAWIKSAQQRITEMFEPPTVEDALNGLKIWWAIIRVRFGEWIASAKQKITEMFDPPTVQEVLQALKDWWGGEDGVRAKFEAWLETAKEKVSEYIKIPTATEIVQWLKDMWGGEKGVKATFESWISTAKQWISEYIKIPTVSEIVQWFKDLWGGESGVRATFESWLETSKNLISKFWELPAVEDFVQNLKGLWEGPGGAKATFETWLENPENRPKITFGYEPPDPDSAESVGFFQQLKQTLQSGINAMFGDIDFMGAILAPLALLFGTDVESGFGGIVEKITGWMETVEGAFNTADEAIDTFFENFNVDTIGPLMDDWAAAIGNKLNEWGVGIGEGFRNLWGWITDIWTGGGDGLNVLTSEKFAAIQLNLSGKFAFMRLAFRILWGWIKLHWSSGWEAIKTTAMTVWGSITTFLSESFDLLKMAFDIAMIWITQGWSTGWETIKTTVSDAWVEIKATMANMFSGFGTWVQERVADVGSGVVAIANGIIGVINSLVRAINKPIRAWNALEFSIAGFSRSFDIPDFLGGGSRSIGWPGFSIPTPNVPTLPSVSRIGYGGGGGIMPAGSIAMLGAGGIVLPTLGGTLAKIGEAGVPEAVIPLDDPRAGRMLGGTGRGPAVNIENVYGWDNLRDLLAEAGVDVQISGARNSFAGI